MSASTNTAGVAGGSARARSERTPIVLIAVAGIALLALAAIVASTLTSQPAAAEAIEVSDVTVDGQALPAWQAGQEDQAVGLAAPSATGWGPNHTAVDVTPGGEPMILAFMAHWCPHCQNELPVVSEWMQRGGADGLEVVAVSTSVDEAKPNYPPSAWFERESFGGPVLVDDEAGSVASAYGLTSFPFFVFVNADGEVAGRVGGELSAEQLDAAVEQLQSTQN